VTTSAAARLDAAGMVRVARERVVARLRASPPALLALSGEEEAMASWAALAAAGGGRVAGLHRPSRAPAAVRELLG
jgi:hypothetical protein